MKKLKYVNNWGTDEYYVGKTRVKTLSRVMINSEEFDVVTKKVSYPVSDHGHDYSVSSDHFIITTMSRGLWFERDLNTIVREDGLTVIPLIWAKEEKS